MEGHTERFKGYITLERIKNDWEKQDSYIKERVKSNFLKGL